MATTHDNEMNSSAALSTPNRNSLAALWGEESLKASDLILQSSEMARSLEVQEFELEKRKEEEGMEIKARKQSVQSLPFYKLFYFADAKDYLLMSLGTVGAIIHGAELPVYFFFFGKLLNGFGGHQENPERMYHVVSKYALYFVFLGAFSLSASLTEISCWMYTSERQTEKLRSQYLEAMLRKDVTFYDTQAQIGDIIEKLSSDTILFQEAIGQKMGNFLHYLSMFSIGFILSFITVWQLAAVMLPITPIIALAGTLFAQSMARSTSKSAEAYSSAGTIAEQAIANIRTVYSFVGEAEVLCSYSTALQSVLRVLHKAGFTKGAAMGSLYGLMFFTWAVLLLTAAFLVRHGSIKGGIALSTILNLVIATRALGQAFPTLATFAKAQASGYKMIQMLQMKPLENKVEPNGITLDIVQGEVEFCEAGFSYPSRPDVPIFTGFSLRIPAAKTVAIVGSSGSGKSTVISLIMRFYDPIQGDVKLDGTSIKLLQVRWLRDQLGLVSQEPALFATSIQDNLLYGKQNASSKEIEEACKAANCHDFISQLPYGYDTQVGQRGIQLSGGQKQRIAIARAILKNPKVLLLDEATSALDAHSEHVVQQALNHAMVGRTTVVVAHRLSTIRHVDTIAVLQQGQIIEMGNHETLISKGETGAYYALVRLQEKDDAENKTIMRRDSRMSSPEHSGSLGGLSPYRSPRSEGKAMNISRRFSAEFENEKEPAVSLWRVIKMTEPDWPYALVASLASMFCGFTDPLYAFLFSRLLKGFYSATGAQLQKQTIIFAGIFAGLGVYSIGLYAVQHYYFGVTGENLTQRVREKMLAAILRNEVSWFDLDENHSSYLASSLSSDATNVKAAVVDRISIIVQNLSMLMAACIVSLVVQWQIALLVFATFPFLVLGALAQLVFMSGIAQEAAKAHGKAHVMAGEALNNFRTVLAFNAEDKILDLFNSQLETVRKRSLARSQVAGAGFGISQFAMYSTHGLCLWFGALLVERGQADFNNVILAFMVVMMSAYGVAQTLALAPELASAGQALLSVFHIIDRKTKIEPDDSQSERVPRITGHIEFHHVHFSYPSRPHVKVFADLNLKINPGQSLALVGASGSGKSSIISLIERFYDPVAGAVLIDGKNIKQLNLRSLREHIGLVQQEPALFSTSIRGNILYGRRNASDIEIVEAAKLANAHGFISTLPEGYETPVGDRGVQLSGGQKQRIAITRAILKNPRILLLDEATSALDAESEKLVQNALDHLMQGRTTVMVAHRLSTIRNANLIAVLYEGAIIEQGSHEALRSKVDGAFARLINMQRMSAP